ncbi:Rad9-domain-containing protein [Mycena olivaceomarginata]|nr:Rad9-domain-containing protein [Mycena olivaceomarginata]
MQTTLDASALKPFTRALACLSRYGEDLAIYATTESISLSTTNSSKSAYCRFKYGRQFFSKYSVGTPDAWANGDEDGPTVSGQLLTKSLLSILRHRTVEKSVERCELSIAEGANPANNRSDEEHDGLESKLIVRLHCKHGVVKTHRLLLLTLTSFLAPGVPDASNESHLTVGPRALRDMIEHFPVAKGARSDPQLIWNFGESEVEVKSFESSLDAKGRTQLATELTISAEEFDLYDVYSTPTTIAFHLREFNATIAFAESMSLALELRFTDPAAPLFIDVEGDNADTLFVISTSQVPGAPMPSQASTTNTKKREREETPRDFARIKKPMKAVQRTDAASLAEADRAASASRSQSLAMSRTSGSMPPPPVPQRSFQSQHDETFDAQMTPGPSRHKEPLFLPMSSQMSAADEQVLRDTGLGIEDMNAEELERMLEDEGDEVEFTGSQVSTNQEMDDVGDDMEFGATQSSDDNLKVRGLSLAITQVLISPRRAFNLCLKTDLHLLRIIASRLQCLLYFTDDSRVVYLVCSFWVNWICSTISR